VAGVGGESWRFGPQVDCVASFDVATIGGALVRVSATENRELFDATRAGLGQCGVILRARFPLRRCGKRIRMRCFAYADIEPFVADLPLVCEDGAPRLVGCAATPDPLRQRRWLLLLFVGSDYDDEHELLKRPQPNFRGREVSPPKDTPFWNETGVPGHIFFRLFAPPDGSLDADPTSLHPWVDHIFPPDRAGAVLEALFSRGGRALSRSKLGMILIRRGAWPAPLFAVPPEEGLLFGLGMFPGFREGARAEALDVMNEYLDAMEPLGGKRYLSGWFPRRDPVTWRNHYGASWETFARAKRRYDPKRLLNPGFIEWDDP